MSPSEGQPPDLDRLQGYLDDQLSEEEVLRLEAELKADPRLCVELVRLARDEAMLLEWARSTQAVHVRNNAEAPVRSSTGRRSRATPRIWLGIAAGLAAAVLLVVLGRGFVLPQPLAHLEQVEGEVLVVNATGSTFAAKNGQDIYPGQALRTGDGSSAVLQYSTLARFELGAETIIRLPVAGPRPGPVRLEEGVLTADFVGQPDTNPMHVQTPHAEARASGSRVNFSSAAGGTLVDPEKGTIEVTRTSDGQSIQVPTGSYAIAAQERGPFVPRPLPARFTTPRATFKESSGPVQVCVLSADGKTLACGGPDGSVNLWDVESGTVHASYRATTRSIQSMSWSHDRRWIATNAEEKDKLVRVWDTRLWREVAALTVPGKTRIAAVAFSPDGSLLATGGGTGGKHPGEVRLWDTRTWKEVDNLTGYTREIGAVAFSADGKLLAAGSADGYLSLWDMPARTLRRTQAAHNQNVRVLAFSPDGNTLVSGGRDAAVRLWDTKTGEEVRTLRDHTGEVRGLAFSPDGRVLATSGADRMVRLYDGNGRRERVSFRGDKQNVCWVGFSPDGRTLFTGGWDRTIKLWDLGEDDPPPPADKSRT